MDDKLIMTNLITTSKSICVLLNIACFESDKDSINNTYKTLLEDVLSQQHRIYKKMKDMGWYPMENVKESEIIKVVKKFKK